jgi:putative DNA primase/helicase
MAKGGEPRSHAVSVPHEDDDDHDAAPAERRKYPTSAEYLAALGDLGYTFAWNEIDDSIEVNGNPINDGLAATMRAQMRDLGFTRMEAVEDAYHAEAYRNRYHPVKQYLESPEWDGQNHILKLCNHIEDANQPIHYENGTASVINVFLRKWLIGAVAKVYEGGKIQNPMLVLDGPQNCGKSSLVRFLGSGLPSLYIEEAIRPDDKDCIRYLPSKWIWEVPELGSTTRRQDREALKAFLTKGDATFRKPYDRHPVTKPTLASFIGTINNEAGFLTDPTGNRRFNVVSIKRINFAYAKTINIHQVWAQAYALYTQGEPWQLQPNEVQTRDELNQSYEVGDPYLDMLQAAYEVETDNPEDCFVTSLDLLQHFKAMGAKASSDKALSMDIATACRRMGVKAGQRRIPGSGERQRGYYGLRLRDLSQP